MKESEQQDIFESWIQKHKGLLFKIVNAYAFDDENRDDLFQEMAIQLWRSVPKFRGDAAPSTWIYRVSLNTAIKWTTKERKHVTGRESIEDVGHVLEHKTEPKDERIKWLNKEIGKLNQIDRSLALLLLDGYSYKEMAQISGISESNLGVKIHRIKKHLINESKKYEHYGV